MYELDLSVILKAMPELIDGLKLTLLISVISSVMAFLMGVIIVFVRSSAPAPLRFVTAAYVEIVRNTPVLIQLYLWYKGFPNFHLNLPPVVCGIMALTLYTGAYISEVMRSGIKAVAQEQYQAARGLGLTKLQTFRMIIFPQAMRITIPPLASQFINLVKNSSLVSFIAVSDLFYVVYKGAVDDFRFFEFFIAGALFYMLVTGIIAVVSSILEHKFRIRGRAVKV